MAMVGSPSLSGNALEFYTTYTWYGGERYYATFGDDTTSSNFVYDGWVYLNNSSGSIANLEMDMNQVMSNGETVIFGFQCDGWNRHLGLHRKCGHAHRTERSLGSVQRPLQCANVGSVRVASRPGQLLAR